MDFGITSWCVSPRPMKIYSISDSRFKQVFQLHTHLYGTLLFLQFLISSRKFWEYMTMVEREMYRFFSFMIFENLTEMPPPNFKIYRKNFMTCNGVLPPPVLKFFNPPSPQTFYSPSSFDQSCKHWSCNVYLKK